LVHNLKLTEFNKFVINLITDVLYQLMVINLTKNIKSILKSVKIPIDPNKFEINLHYLTFN